MSSIFVRGLDETVKQPLVEKAKKNGRSLEAEVRDTLTQAASRPHIGLVLFEAARSVGGVDELPIPERRDTARVSDFE